MQHKTHLKRLSTMINGQLNLLRNNRFINTSKEIMLKVHLAFCVHDILLTLEKELSKFLLKRVHVSNHFAATHFVLTNIPFNHLPNNKKTILQIDEYGNADGSIVFCSAPICE